MNNTSELPADNPRPNTVEHLIVVGLGYCCEWFFWTRFEHIPADLVAARLGVTDDTVRRHRLWYRDGRFKCKCKTSCMVEHLEITKKWTPKSSL